MTTLLVPMQSPLGPTAGAPTSPTRSPTRKTYDAFYRHEETTNQKNESSPSQSPSWKQETATTTSSGVGALPLLPLVDATQEKEEEDGNDSCTVPLATMTAPLQPLHTKAATATATTICSNQQETGAIVVVDAAVDMETSSVDSSTYVMVEGPTEVQVVEDSQVAVEEPEQQQQQQQHSSDDLLEFEDETSPLSPVANAMLVDDEPLEPVSEALPLIGADNDNDIYGTDPTTTVSEPLITTQEPMTLPLEQQQEDYSNPFLPATTTTNTEEEGEKLPYGGLKNLGNTCYLNSALQMLASLDDFATLLREHFPLLEKEEDQPTLRTELLSVLDRLATGENVCPESLKSKMDERSPLFIGYRQQDSHEFLTTLIDLLDEDYKKKETPKEQEAEPMDVVEPEKDATETTAPADQLAEDLADLDSLGGDQQQEDEDDGRHSPLKKQRLDREDREHLEDDKEEETPTESTTSNSSSSCEDAASAATTATTSAEPTLTTSQSFKDLQFAGIEDLLHGDGTSKRSSIASHQTAGEDEYKCKLVGGRMSTSGVNLTQWDDTDKLPPSSASLDAVQMSMDETEDLIVENMEQKTEAKPYSPIDDYFTTEVRVCLTCNSCKYRRSHKETYLHLSLEIGPTIGSIEEGLRAFFKPEKREIKCEKCFHEYASQTTEITKLPRALLVHLKRFIVDVSPDYTSISYRKDQSSVDFDSTLALDETEGALGEVLADEVAIPPNRRYGIRSVVNHIGSSASCGHYTADAQKVSPHQSQREWIRFNDSYVSEITAHDAVEQASSTAYMVLYELEENL